MASRPDLPPVFGRFRILRKLGEGGMGAVYLAEDTRLGYQVALKVPFFRDGEERKVIERFLREARLAQSVHHPFICQIFEADVIDGVHYLTMAFIEGWPLRKLV